MTALELPKYERIKQLLIREIESGQWASGEAMPSEAELVERFNVSRPTLVRSLRDLEQAGYLVRRQGKGTFVAKRTQAVSPVSGRRMLPVFVSTVVAGLKGDAREVLLRLLRGIQSAVGVELVLRHVAPDVLDPETQDFLNQTPAGPILIVESSFNKPLLEELIRRKWNVWTLNEPSNLGNSVMIDQEQAGYLATMYMIQKGCRKIALLNGPVAAYWGFEARQHGYLRALAEAGIAPDPTLIRQADHVIDSEAGRLMMCELLAAGIRPDGIVGTSDSKAIGALTAAQEAGIKVQQDMHFVGIDNTVADSVTPPLPAVSMPFEEVGRTAAMMAVSQPVEASASFHYCIQIKPSVVER